MKIPFKFVEHLFGHCSTDVTVAMLGHHYSKGCRLPFRTTRVFAGAAAFICSVRFAVAIAQPIFPATNASPQTNQLTAQAAHELPDASASKNYPVQLEAVVLARDVNRDGLMAAIVQDATSPIFLRLNSAAGKNMQVGHRYRITGIAQVGDFSRNIVEQKSVDLGVGKLPEPLRPSFEELVNTGLNCDWVELEGVIRPTGPLGLQLILKGGHVNLRLAKREDFAAVMALTNAWVKLRGCVIPYRTSAGQVTGAALILVPGSDFVLVKKAAPENLFALPATHVADWLRFDRRREFPWWTKLSGQIARVRGNTIFLLDDGNGARCLVADAAGLAPGDTIEATGLLGFTGSSPMLRDAVVRKNGHSALPPARRVKVDDLLPFRREGTNIEQTAEAVRDGSWVGVEGRLVRAHPADSELLLEMQAGLRMFQAILPTSREPKNLPPIGSQLQLRGVVATWDQSAGGQYSAFDLLLNSPDDIAVLQLPPRWTLRDVLLLVAGLLVVVALGTLWIFQLRRRVEQSTRQLRVEMEERRRVEDRVRSLEMQSALENERARIARDIHDELGARATKISLLANASLQDLPAESGGQLRQISLASQQLVRALDETVWTVNPGNDSLANLLDYLTHFAEEFFRDTPVRCQLKLPVDVPDCPMSTEMRYSLLAIVKETLNNTLKHAAAQKVVLSARFENGCLRLEMQDDGRGFSAGAAAAGNGLPNLRERAAAMGAIIKINSEPGKGTTVQVKVSLRDKHAQL